MSIEKTAITPPQNNPPRPASDVAAIPEPPHGRPKAASAPLGGSEPRAAGSVGATTLALLLMFCALNGATFRPWLA